VPGGVADEDRDVVLELEIDARQREHGRGVLAQFAQGEGGTAFTCGRDRRAF